MKDDKKLIDSSNTANPILNEEYILSASRLLRKLPGGNWKVFL